MLACLVISNAMLPLFHHMITISTDVKVQTPQNSKLPSRSLIVLPQVTAHGKRFH